MSSPCLIGGCRTSAAERRVRHPTMTVKTMNIEHRSSDSRKSKILQGRRRQTSHSLRSGMLTHTDSHEAVSCGSAWSDVFGRRYAATQMTTRRDQQQTHGGTSHHRRDRQRTSRFSRSSIQCIVCIFYTTFYILESFLESIIYTLYLYKNSTATAGGCGGQRR
jgi:hypothetical protein